MYFDDGPQLISLFFSDLSHFDLSNDFDQRRFCSLDLDCERDRDLERFFFDFDVFFGLCFEKYSLFSFDPDFDLGSGFFPMNLFSSGDIDL